MHSFNFLKSFPLGVWGDHDLSNLFLYTILDPNFVLISTIHIYSYILHIHFEFARYECKHNTDFVLPWKRRNF